MKKEILIKSNNRTEIIDITDIISKEIVSMAIESGICLIYVPHTTAGLFVNENYDLSVKKDILNKLSDIVPYNANYLHAEGNSDSHIKASLIGNSVNLIIENSKLVLGKWEGLFFAEFDGPRSRKLYIKVCKD